MKKNNIFLDRSKSNYYIKNKIRHSYNSLYKSQSNILKKIKLNNSKVLDVGCATGNMFNVLNNKYQIDYTGIDIDKKCIRYAKKKYKTAKFITCDIFSKKIKKNSFDVVMIWNLFHMFPNWKQILTKACEISRKYVIFDNRVKYSGQTVVDKDLSYQYYHLSNKRNYYIVHNIYELISFFQIHELNLEYVYGYGYKMRDKTSSRLPFRESDALVGSFLLKKSKKKFLRTGVQPQSKNESWVKTELNFPGLKK